MISKQKLAKIISEVKLRTKLQQWKNSDWFENLEDKKKLSFIQFDLVEFYPSITEKLLVNALNFAANYTEIPENDRKLILQCRKSYLCSKNSVWVKKGVSNFYVTMGSYDGAEICDIAGLYMLSKLQNLNLNI